MMIVKHRNSVEIVGISFERGEGMMREWLVIEKTWKRAVFAGDDADRKGYIPRDVAENLLGRNLAEEGRVTWFTCEDSEKLRAHPEWRDTEPPHTRPDLAGVGLERRG